MSSRRRWGLAALVVAGVALLYLLWDRVGSDDEAPRSVNPSTAAARDEELEPSRSCGHPYAPSETGTVLVYRWTGREGEGEITMRVLGSERAGEGWRVRWRAETTGPPEPRVWLGERYCGARSAEEPWLELGTVGLVRLTEPTWRLPAELRSGTDYSGTTEASVAGLSVTMTRAHHVEGHERVITEAGNFDAVRLRVEERTEHAAEPTVSVQWVARGPGLVRMEQGREPMAFTYELVSWTPVRAP